MKTDFNHINRIVNPAKLFFIVWTFTILFYLLDLSDEVLPANFSSIFFIITCTAIVYLTGHYKSDIIIGKHYNNYSLNKRNIIIVLSICLSLLIYEVITEFKYFGTLPFLASFSFEEVNYNDATHIFKYKHNFYVKANSIFLAGYFFYLYLITNRKKIFLYGYLLIIVISLLYITRSTLVSIGVTSLIIYLSFYKIKTKHIIIGIVLLICFLYIFDKLYFLRNKADMNFYINHYENFGFWKSVIRGAEGFYIYLASPISNLLYNIDIGTFKDFAFHPLYLIEGFLPTKFVMTFLGENLFNTTIVFPGISNTFTTYPPLLFAFGLYGMFFLIVLLGILLKYIYINSLNNPSKWFLVLVFVNHIVFLSLFSTSLINPVFFFPIILSFIFPPVNISVNK